MLINPPKPSTINICIVSQGPYCQQLLNIDTSLQNSLESPTISTIKLHQLSDLAKDLPPNTFIILQTKQLVINRFLQQQLEEINKRQATIIMVPNGRNLQTKHLIANSSKELIALIRLHTKKPGMEIPARRLEIENQDSKSEQKGIPVGNRIACYLLKSVNREFNTLMNVLEIKYKEKENVSFYWISNPQELTGNQRECILIISQHEVASQPQLQKQINTLRFKPFLILFKNTLNRNQSSIKFNIQTSSILGIQKLINSSDYKTFFKTPLSPSNSRAEIRTQTETVILAENREPEGSVGGGRGGQIHNSKGMGGALRVHTSAHDVLEGERVGSSQRFSFELQGSKPADGSVKDVRDSMVSSERRIDNKISSSPAMILPSPCNPQPSETHQRTSSIFKSNIRIQPKPQVESIHPSFKSETIIPASSLKHIRKLSQSNIIHHQNQIPQPKNESIPQSTTPPLPPTKRAEPQRTSYLMKDIHLHQPKSILQTINNRNLTQIIIRNTEKLGQLVQEFQKQSYHVETYSTPQELDLISQRLSPTLPTVHVTDSGLDDPVDKLFKRFTKFNTLTVQKAKISTLPLIRNPTPQTKKDDPKILSSQLKTYISRINSVSKSKPTSAPSDFNVIIKDNLMSRVNVDQFLKPRMFSPPFLPSGIDRLKPNVIVIEQEDYSLIRKELSPQDKVIVLAKQGQLVKQDLCKAVLTTKNPEAITGFIRKLSVEGRAHSHILYNYQQSGIQQQIHKRMKGKLIQLKYHDQQSLLKKASTHSKSKLTIILNLQHLKLVKEIQQMSKEINLIVYEPNYRLSIETPLKVFKTITELVQELEILAFRN